ncbi:sensor histidine kinase [Stackebrandtia soli]|uniref:sensor histidine kinase n=1 Tax=Stackebrandtia soli TaxID=1892856 RepID=UPI0039E791C0
MTGWNDRTLWIDAGIAVILGVATAVTTIPAVDGDGGEAAMGPLGFAIVAATALCLTFRRRYPIGTVAAVVAGTTAYTLLGYPYGPIFILLAAAMGTLAAYRGTRTAVTTCAVLIVASVPYSLIADSDDDSPVVNVVISVVWIVLSTMAGMAFRQARMARLRAKDAERHRVQAQERLDMAREVHDVVGHSLAVINLHAGVIQHVLNRDNVEVPEPVRSSLAAIRESGSDALRDLRATLAPPTSTAPVTRGVADLRALVDNAAAEGLRVRVQVDGDARRLPPSVDTAVYRIAQEALTNVLKHADASGARIEIAYLPDVVTIAITDNGRGGNGAPGTGLTGMRQRAESLGGVFEAGPGETGGFTVRARLPYATVAP